MWFTTAVSCCSLHCVCVCVRCLWACAVATHRVTRAKGARRDVVVHAMDVRRGHVSAVRGSLFTLCGTRTRKRIYCTPITSRTEDVVVVYCTTPPVPGVRHTGRMSRATNAHHRQSGTMCRKPNTQHSIHSNVSDGVSSIAHQPPLAPSRHYHFAKGCGHGSILASALANAVKVALAYQGGWA